MYTKDANGKKKQVTTKESYKSVEGYKLRGPDTGSGSGNVNNWFGSFFGVIITDMAIGMAFVIVLIVLILYFVFRKRSTNTA